MGTCCGVVAEYNPLHNGHRYQLEQAKALTGADSVVVVMSGNFTQRGEPALCDKQIRTAMALHTGADLVLELPVFFATAGAEFFARGAVAVLHQSGIIDHLCFGSESGDLSALSKTAALLSEESTDFQFRLKESLARGLSFPTARQEAIRADCAFDLTQPNDILAVAYLRALKTLNSPIRPWTIQRAQAGHHNPALPLRTDRVGATEPQIASATAIRRAVLLNPPTLRGDLNAVMPKPCPDLLLSAIADGTAPHHLDRFSDIFRFLLATTPREALGAVLDMNEGLEGRFLAAAACRTISEFVAHAKTKRYTYTRLQRAALHTILQIKKEPFLAFVRQGGPQYIRVLGFRREKSALLARLKQAARLPVLLNLKHADKLSPMAQAMLAHEIRATDVYYSVLDAPQKINREYHRFLCVI